VEFIPLAIWAAGVFVVLGYMEIECRKAGVAGASLERLIGLYLLFWALGCLVFLALGVACFLRGG